MRVHVLIFGRVQGVFFRAHTKDKADELGLDGWVKNRGDGGVEAVFVGPPDKVEAMIKWCRRGPPKAEVEKVEISRKQVEKKLTGFEIKY
jgi:acylphosphatase